MALLMQQMHKSFIPIIIIIFSNSRGILIWQFPRQTIRKFLSSSESEGIRLVKQTASYLLKQKKPWLIPDLILASGFKFLGYKAGQHYRRIPRWLVEKLTMNRAY